MQVVDTWFVGKLSAAAVGGVSIGNAVFFTVMVFGIGLIYGMDFPASKAFGAGRRDEGVSYLVQALILATAISLPLSLALHVGAGHLDLLGVSDPELARQAGQYLRSVSWSLWPVLAFVALRQYLQSTGVATPVTVILILANVINALGNWVFVLGRLGFESLGVAGSGYSTTVARVFTLLACAVYFNHRIRRTGLTSPAHELIRLNWPRLREILGLGIPAALQSLLEVGVFATASFVVGRLGAQALAAHQIVLQIASFTFMIPLGLSSAAAVRVAQNLGEGRPQGAVEIGHHALFLGAGFMAASGLCLYLLAEPILTSFTPDPGVLLIGRKLLLAAAFFQVADGIQVTATGVLRGIGNTRASMLANFAGHWILGLPLGIALGFHFAWGALGVWIGLSVGLFFVAAALVAAWRSLSRPLFSRSG